MPSITKQQAYNLLRAVPASCAFSCVDGRVAHSLEELRSLLLDMPDDIFTYHSSPDKNDFSDWVAAIIGDRKLAGHLREARDRIQVLAAVSLRIAFLKNSSLS